MSYSGQGGDPPIEGFELSVIGKGDKPRVVPIAPVLITELGEYLASRGLSADPMDVRIRGAHLLGRDREGHRRAPNLVRPDADGKAGISVSTLARQLCGFFEACSRELALRGDQRGADRLAHATTHWLRHYPPFLTMSCSSPAAACCAGWHASRPT
jgi:hypothetical protein